MIVEGPVSHQAALVAKKGAIDVATQFGLETSPVPNADLIDLALEALLDGRSLAFADPNLVASRIDISDNASALEEILCPGSVRCQNMGLV